MIKFIYSLVGLNNPEESRREWVKRINVQLVYFLLKDEALSYMALSYLPVTA